MYSIHLSRVYMFMNEKGKFKGLMWNENPCFSSCLVSFLQISCKYSCVSTSFPSLAYIALKRVKKPRVLLPQFTHVYKYTHKVHKLLPGGMFFLFYLFSPYFICLFFIFFCATFFFLFILLPLLADERQKATLKSTR